MAHTWLILAGLLLIAELLSGTFYLLMLAVAALGAWVAMMLGVDFLTQTIVFLIGAAILTVLTRRYRYASMPVTAPTLPKIWMPVKSSPFAIGITASDAPIIVARIGRYNWKPTIKHR